MTTSRCHTGPAFAFDRDGFSNPPTTGHAVSPSIPCRPTDVAQAVGVDHATSYTCDSHAERPAPSPSDRRSPPHPSVLSLADFHASSTRWSGAEQPTSLARVWLVDATPNGPTCRLPRLTPGAGGAAQAWRHRVRRQSSAAPACGSPGGQRRRPRFTSPVSHDRNSRTRPASSVIRSRRSDASDGCSSTSFDANGRSCPARSLASGLQSTCAGASRVCSVTYDVPSAQPRGRRVGRRRVCPGCRSRPPARLAR